MSKKFAGHCISCNFILPTHQRKGGIHAIYRSIMEASGYHCVTGLSKK